VPVDPALVLGFLLLSALLSAVPGPSVLLETSRAITQGRASAMWVVLGNAAGGMVLLALVLTGLGAVVATSARLFVVVKLLGALYLLWLGLRSLVDARRGSAGDLGTMRASRPVARIRLVRQGFLVGVANPKSIVSLIAVLPQFVDPSRGDVTLQLLIIGVLGGATQVLIETVWVVGAGSLRSWFVRQPGRARALKAVGGVAMIGFAGRLAVDR
jgi:threonine/homoserine/homoserine lactone efflux protein